MMKPRNFLEVHKVLKGYISGQSFPGTRYTLERITRLMDFLGNPQNDYKVIHVAGTSGKTSTSYYVAAQLRVSGVKVGLSVSPHVDEVNERVQLDMEPLKESRYCSEFSIFLGLVEESGIMPTYFELLVAFAFWEFKRAKVDYAVIEVGLGGLLDSTNVITREDKVCVITDIGLDHIEILGHTLTEITVQKAGIIHRDNHVFSFYQSSEVNAILKRMCDRQAATLYLVDASIKSEVPGYLPLFQQRNWYLARKIYQYLAVRDDLLHIEVPKLNAAAATYIPARMEVIKFKDKQIIMDGAHNAQKIEALVRSMQHTYPDQPVAVLISFVTTKQSRLRQDIEALVPLASHIIITSFRTAGAPRDSIDPVEISKICDELGNTSYEVFDNPKNAFRKLLKRPEPVLLITGSFYLLNHIRPLVLKS